MTAKEIVLQTINDTQSALDDVFFKMDCVDLDGINTGTMILINELKYHSELLRDTLTERF